MNGLRPGSVVWRDGPNGPRQVQVLDRAPGSGEWWVTGSKYAVHQRDLYPNKNLKVV